MAYPHFRVLAQQWIRLCLDVGQRFFHGLIAIENQGDFRIENILDFGAVGAQGIGTCHAILKGRLLTGNDQLPYIGLCFAFGFRNDPMGIVGGNSPHRHELFLAFQLVAPQLTNS